MPSKDAGSVEISVNALAMAHDIAAVADHHEGATDTDGDRAVYVNLADLRALRAMLPKRESEKEKADRLFGEYKEAGPLVPRLCEKRVWCDLPFEHEGRCAPAQPPKMVRCDPCRMWHKAPAHSKEGAKT